MFCLRKADRTFEYVTHNDLSDYVCLSWENYSPEALSAAYEGYLASLSPVVESPVAEAPVVESPVAEAPVEEVALVEEVAPTIEDVVADEQVDRDSLFALQLESEAQAELEDAILDEVA